ncbi:transposase [Streptomyces sp. NPDC058297]|uniref:transposase n=1 Tax=Streptomyces sp. NPDC058297 TaxID=3346433 RepID=UPI0036E85111
MTQDTPDEKLSAAIFYVLVSSYAWRQLPHGSGILKQSTAHRQFMNCSRADVWLRLRKAAPHRLDGTGLVDAIRVDINLFDNTRAVRSPG